MTITLYQYQKRENSTARPSGGSSIQGTLRNNSSVVSPTVEFSAQNLSGYNYAYIPVFSRWYFIRNWSYIDGLWLADMECDTLATYRDQIGASEQYVLRSSADYDGEIVDTMYPAKSAGVFEDTAGFIFGDGPDTDTFYVVGIVGNNSDGGAVTYYSMTAAQFNVFSGKLMGSTEYLGTDFGDITQDWLKTQYNPFQYVASVKTFPFGFSGSRVDTVSLGWYTIECGATRITKDVVSKRVEFNVPKHPQQSRGSFLNTPPFTRVTLYHPSFGSIPLDTNFLSKANKIQIDLSIDAKTGDGVADISVDMFSYLQRPARLGVNVQVGQMASDYAGYFASGVGALGSLWSGDFKGVVSNIGNAAESLLPQMQTSGQNGTTMGFREPVHMIAEFLRVVDEDNEDNGRPLCQKRTVSTLPGYVKTENPDIAITGTAEEARTIKSYMEGGFFFE